MLTGHCVIRAMRPRIVLPAVASLSLLAGCGGGGGSSDSVSGSTAGLTPAQRQPARCANFSDEAYVTREALAAGALNADADLMLRFVQLTDDHIIDDDGQAVAGASILDPLEPTFEAAMRLQEEYTDETLNDLIGGLNACDQAFPSSFAIVTGDSADLTTVAETRRYIDNLDGGFDRVGAFETRCRAELPADAPDALVQTQCTRFTGRGVADTQSVDPNPDDPTYQFIVTRSVQQLLANVSAATGGRAADGSLDATRQTATRSPGMPEVLRCNAGEAGCANQRLRIPYLMAFGNHDAYVRGTLPVGSSANLLGNLVGRRLMLDPHDFIDEFYFTSAQPGPVGHGFQFADAARRNDTDPTNDGYYAFDAGGGRFRMIVMNTIIDGRDPSIPGDVLRNPFALADGSVDAEQFAWIKAELAAAHDAGQLVMVFSHHPDLSFAEFGMFADLVPVDVTAAQLNAEFASWPNLIAWVAGHTHRHRIRAFRVSDGEGSNGEVTTPVECRDGAGNCAGFWQIETASLVDFPQQQRLLEVFDNGDGTGVIRGSVLNHEFERSKTLARADDRCALYLSDPEAVAAALSDAGMNALCMQGGTREGGPEDRNVALMFRMPRF